MTLFQKLIQQWHQLEYKFIPPKAWERNFLTLWQERIIFSIFFFAAVLAPFALIPSLILSIQEGLWGIFILDTTSYLTVLLVLFSKKLSLMHKTWITFFLFYLLGTSLLFILGFYGAGYIWLFGASLITGTILGFKAAGFSLLLNFSSLAAIGVYIAVGSPQWSSVAENPLEKWIVMIVNFMLINTLITLLVAGMMNSLKRALSEQKAAQKELTEEKEFSEYIINSMPGIFFLYAVKNETFILKRWNKNYETILGYSKTGLKDSTLETFFDKENYNLVKESMAELTDQGTTTLEIEILKNNGESIPFVFQNFLLKKREQIYLIGTGIDLTERVSAEKEKIKFQNRLAQTQKMEALGTLAGGIAHDFNNILSGIFGYAELAKTNFDDPEKFKKNINQIVAGARRSGDLVQQILAFSRQTEFKKIPIRLYLVIKEAVKFLRSSIPSNIEIQEKISYRTTVLADPTQMHQIVMNLCTNASHAMSKTGGILSVSLEEIDFTESDRIPELNILPGPYLRLEVKDTGLGMDTQTLEKIFEPYFTTKEIGEGTGLGLAVVLGIVEKHNGYVKAYSEIGKGSTFHMYLPVLENVIESFAPPKKGPVIRRGKERIMLVDDEKSIRLSIQSLIEDYGYKVDIFSDGEQAFNQFKEDITLFDLIITDMTMPKILGDELSIKILNIRNDMPIILCSGYSDKISKTKAYDIGIKKYLQKPVDSQSLLLLIREILDNK